MKIKRKVYNHFNIIAYPAKLAGDEHLIQQNLAHTKCHYNRYYCTPQEMPKSKIAWKQIRRDSRLFHSIGYY